MPLTRRGLGRDPLVNLMLANTNATATVLWTSAIVGRATGSTIIATASDGTVLTVDDVASTASGTFAVAGSPTVTLTETKLGATNSPLASPAIVVTVV